MTLYNNFLLKRGVGLFSRVGLISGDYGTIFIIHELSMGLCYIIILPVLYSSYYKICDHDISKLPSKQRVLNQQKKSSSEQESAHTKVHSVRLHQ